MYDPVTGVDIVEQEIAVGMDDFVAQGVGDGKRAAINDRAGGGGNDGADMTSGAANFVEEQLSCPRRGRGSQTVEPGALAAT